MMTRSGAEPGSLVILTDLEVVEVLQPPFGAIDQRAVIGVALGDIELAPDDIVARARVAADVDALDVGVRTFLDDESQIDLVAFEIAIAARPHDRERIAALGDLDGHVFDGLFDRVGVVDAARRHPQLRAQRIGIDGADVRHDIDRAEAILIALVDREGDDEALVAGIEFGDRRDDAHIGIAVLEIELAQQVAVGLDAIRIVEVVALIQLSQSVCAVLTTSFRR